MKEIEIPECCEAKIVGNKVVFVPKESEDERVRMDILEALRYGLACEESTLMPGAKTTLKEAIAYLEKQKEQKSGLKKANDLRTWLNIVSKVLTEFQGIGQYLDNPICQEIANMLREKYCFDDASSDWDRVYRNGLDAGEIYGYNKAKKKQKPVNLDEDVELGLDRALQIVKAAKGNLSAYQTDDGIYECDHAIQTLEHILKNGIGQKPAEWSEKDERIMDHCIGYINASCLDANDLYECIDWLESLHRRTKSSDSWKPSEEHFQGLRRAIIKAEKGSDAWKSLTDLYEYLKNL